MNRIRAALGACFVALLIASPAPALAEDRVNSYYAQVPDQNWFNQAARDPRIGLGQLVYDLTGNTNPFFANLVGAPSGGLYMSIGPGSTNSMGALYQYLADDVTPVGGSPIGATGSTTLAADPTTIFLQALVGSPNVTIGPFTPPATSGQSIAYLAECQVQTIDRTPQSESFIQPPNNTPGIAVANRDRADILACQPKAGSPAQTPIAPTVDSGWVPLATVTVAAGATALTPSNIVRTASTQFSGFVPASSTGGISIASFPHGDYLDTGSTAQTKSGALTISGALTANSLASAGGLTALNANISSGLSANTASITGLLGAGSLTVGSAGILDSGTLGVNGLATVNQLQATNGVLAAAAQITHGISADTASIANLLGAGTLQVQTTANVGGNLTVNGQTTTNSENITTAITVGTTGNFSGAVTAPQYVTSSARALKFDLHRLELDPLSIVRTVHPTWWKYKARPAMQSELGAVADDTSSALSGPQHDHLDIGATAVVAAAAAAEVGNREDALQKQVSAIADRSALDALTKRVDSLEGIVVFLLILIGGLIASSIALWRVVLKLTRAQRAAA